MGGWGNATRHGAWNTTRRERSSDLHPHAGRWTAPDVGLVIVAFVLHYWEVGLALVALKLWQQASGFEGSLLAFARDRWEALVGTTRGMMAGTSAAMPFTSRGSGNKTFDAWREGELARIEAERAKLRTAEREFSSYREELLHAKDREDFERFMRARDTLQA